MSAQAWFAVIVVLFLFVLLVIGWWTFMDWVESFVNGWVRRWVLHRERRTGAEAMTPADLANDLERLSAAATKGPWYPQTFDYPTREEQAAKLRKRLDFSESLSSTFIRKDEPNVDVGTTGNGPTSEANAALIAALRNNADLLIAALRLAEVTSNSGAGHDKWLAELRAYRAAREDR